jgi:hypothetical protein
MYVYENKHKIAVAFGGLGPYTMHSTEVHLLFKESGEYIYEGAHTL